MLDLTDLAPPEPLQRVLDAVDELRSGERLRVRLRHEPFPLYSLLRPMGYEWSGELLEDGFELLIWSSDDDREEDAPSC